jgi:hypothetical protein
MPRPNSPDEALLRRWVETWRRAGPELEAIRLAELQSVDTREAVRQIFSAELRDLPPVSPTSGLVEQQAWFARLHRRQ